MKVRSYLRWMRGGGCLEKEYKRAPLLSNHPCFIFEFHGSKILSLLSSCCFCFHFVVFFASFGVMEVPLHFIIPYFMFWGFVLSCRRLFKVSSSFEHLVLLTLTKVSVPSSLRVLSCFFGVYRCSLVLCTNPKANPHRTLAMLFWVAQVCFESLTNPCPTNTCYGSLRVF